MNRLYRFLACSLIAAGAQLSARAQALPFNNTDAYFVKVGGSNAGFIHYNAAENKFDLVTSQWDADPVFFELVENKFRLIWIGEGGVSMGAADSNNNTYLKADEDEGMLFTLENNGTAYNFRSTIGSKGYLNNNVADSKLVFSNVNGANATVSVEKADYKKLYEEAKSPLQKITTSLAPVRVRM